VQFLLGGHVKPLRSKKGGTHDDKNFMMENMPTRMRTMFIGTCGRMAVDTFLTRKRLSSWIKGLYYSSIGDGY
jgi:hypothetical protein